MKKRDFFRIGASSEEDALLRMTSLNVFKWWANSWEADMLRTPANRYNYEYE